MGRSSDKPWPDVPETRRRTMAAIRGRDTKPEMAVRSLLHRLGYRFRVGLRQLSVRPDIVFTARRKVIFVHGCFWHAHDVCRSGRVPQTRKEYWSGKLEANKTRDARVVAELEANGWSVLVVWECEVGDKRVLTDRLVRFLGPVCHPTHSRA